MSWLGFDWQTREYYASDYFEQLYHYAIQLIQKNYAYVCDLNPEETSEYRGVWTKPGRESPYRNRSVEENLDLFKVAQEGNAEQIKELIDSVIDFSKKDANGRNVLMHAVIFGNKETVLELLKEFKQLEKKDVQGMNPLALSLRYGDSEITKIL